MTTLVIKRKLTEKHKTIGPSHDLYGVSSMCFSETFSDGSVRRVEFTSCGLSGSTLNVDGKCIAYADILAKDDKVYDQFLDIVNLRHRDIIKLMMINESHYVDEHIYF